MKKDIPSIVQDETICFLCKRHPREREWCSRLEVHHCFPGARRNLSVKYGLWVYLCPKHHYQVHFDPKHAQERLREIQREAEMCWLLAHHKNIEDFIAEFGMNVI